MSESTSEQRLKALERIFQQSEAEVLVREKQLGELRPKRTAMEQECKDVLGCTISELPASLKRDDAKMLELIEELEAEVESAQGPR